MLKTHRKSLLALALVPTLFVAQLTGLAGSTPNSAHAASTPSIILQTNGSSINAVAPGNTLTINGGSFQAGAVTIVINSANPVVSGTQAGSVPGATNTNTNGDNTETPPTAPATAYSPNSITIQATAVGFLGTLNPVTITLPSSMVSGTYLVSAVDTTGNTPATAKFTVVNSGTDLTISPNSNIALGGHFNVTGTFTAGQSVSYALEDFGQGTAGTSLSGSGATLAHNIVPTVIPLVVVSCLSGSTGAATSSQWQFTIPTGALGTFNLKAGANTTATPLTAAATTPPVATADIVTALGALASVGSTANVQVQQAAVSSGTQYTVTFTGTAAGIASLTVLPLAAGSGGLTVPVAATATLANTQLTSTWTYSIADASTGNYQLQVNGGTATGLIAEGQDGATVVQPLLNNFAGVLPAGVTAAVTSADGGTNTVYTVVFTSVPSDGAAPVNITNFIVTGASGLGGAIVQPALSSTAFPTATWALGYTGSPTSGNFVLSDGTGAINSATLAYGAPATAGTGNVQDALKALTAIGAIGTINTVAGVSVAAASGGVANGYVITLVGATPSGLTLSTSLPATDPLVGAAVTPTITPVQVNIASGNTCVAPTGGYVSATLALSSASSTAILSSAVFDQVWAIVATGTLVNTTTVVNFTSINVDHSGTVVFAQPSPSAPGGTETITGYGFGADADIYLWLGGETSVTNGCILSAETTPATVYTSATVSHVVDATNEAGDAGPIWGVTTSSSSFALGACLLNTTPIVADANGNIPGNTTVTIPSVGTISGTGGAQIVAEDFATSAPSSVTG